MSYSNGLQTTHRFAAADLATAAVIGRIVGPNGLTGRVTSVSILCTTGITVADGVVSVGTSADANAYGDYTAPITAANARVDGVWTEGVDNRVDADSVVEVSADGVPTAGAGDVVVTIEWS